MRPNFVQGMAVRTADAGMSQAELLHMQQRITEQMVYASQAVAPYLAAVIGTAARHLSGATCAFAKSSCPRCIALMSANCQLQPSSELKGFVHCKSALQAVLEPPPQMDQEARKLCAHLSFLARARNSNLIERAA